MNLLCGMFENIWNKFYSTCVRNISESTRNMISVGLILFALILFVFSTKGSKKGDMIGSWFIFWISIIFFIAGIVYISL